MKHFYKLFLIFTFLSLTNAAMAVAVTSNETVKFNSPNTPIRVQANQPEFTLTLQSNPTTGYSWFLVRYNNKLISAVNHKYMAPNSKLIGAPGYEIWTFKLTPEAFVVPRTTKIVMVYARPWEHKGGEKAVFNIYTGK